MQLVRQTSEVRHLTELGFAVEGHRPVSEAGLPHGSVYQDAHTQMAGIPFDATKRRIQGGVAALKNLQVAITTCDKKPRNAVTAVS